MATHATIFKAELQISDLDRHYYATHQLTVARHPSENDARMMMRIAAFALNANEQLRFTKGLCCDDEPDLWQKSLSDEIECWIDLGLPDEKRIRRACGRSRQVIIYSYNDSAAEAWRQKLQGKWHRFDNLKITHFEDEGCASLPCFAHRTMQLQFTISDGTILLTDGEQALQMQPHTIKS